MAANWGLVVGLSRGEDCILCEHPIQEATKVIEVNVKYKLGFIRRTFRGEVHPHCANDLRGQIVDKLVEVKK